MSVGLFRIISAMATDFDQSFTGRFTTSFILASLRGVVYGIRGKRAKVSPEGK